LNFFDPRNDDDDDDDDDDATALTLTNRAFNTHRSAILPPDQCATKLNNFRIPKSNSMGSPNKKANG
jgi:hypothetical protein